MKKFARTVVIAMLALSSISFASEGDVSHVVSLDQLTEQEAHQFFEYGTDSIVIQVQEGLSLPVQFFLTGEMLELRQDDGADWMVDINKTFFMKHDTNGFLFSLDLVNWYALEAFITGKITAEFKVDEGFPCLRFGGEVNSRLD